MDAAWLSSVLCQIKVSNFGEKIKTPAPIAICVTSNAGYREDADGMHLEPLPGGQHSRW